MAMERRGREVELIDVLDRILDKGIVLDAWTRVSRTGIDVLTAEDQLNS